MLEAPQDESVLRWGREGDTFVILNLRCAGAGYGENGSAKLFF
jgi:hypothetical protein